MRAVRPTKKTHPDQRVADQKDAVAGFKRLHVLVTEQQYRKLKKIAFERDARLAVVVREGLADWLGKQP